MSTVRTGCRVAFTKIETAEFVFASVLLSSMFVIAYQWPLFLAFLFGAFGLMVHELGHKLAGRWRCIEDVHFTIMPIGIAAGFAVAILFGQALAAPGGVTVGKNASRRDRVIMGLAGPLTNLLMFILFYGLHIVSPLTLDLGGVGIGVSAFPIWAGVAFVNLYLAFFNMLPIPMFDGSHIFRENQRVWFVVIFAIGVFVAVFAGKMLGTLGPLFTGSFPGIFGLALNGELGKIIGPLTPGLMLFNRDTIKRTNALFHSTLDTEYTEL